MGLGGREGCARGAAGGWKGAMTVGDFPPFFNLARAMLAFGKDDKEINSASVFFFSPPLLKYTV